MKLVFIGSLSNVSASGRQRLWALEQNNAKVTALNIDDYKKSKWIYRFVRLFKFSSLLVNEKLEKDIFDCCQQILPDIIWFEWPREVSGNLLQKLKIHCSSSLLISFQDDNPWGNRKKDYWMWDNYFKNIPYFDLHMVKRESDINNIKLLGGKFCYLWKHGIYSPLFNALELKKDSKYPVSFVGTCMDKREVLIGFLLVNNINIHVFGNKWNERTDLPKRFPENFHCEVEGADYAGVIKNSQICLGLVSHSNIDEWTMRSYEVPACQSLLIAEDTEAHRILFDELSENILFKNNEECLLLINFFLKNPDILRTVSLEINERFVSNNWTLENRMACFLSSLNGMKSQLI